MLGVVIMRNSANGFRVCRDVLEQLIGGTHPLIEWEFNSDENDEESRDGDIPSNWWEIYGV